MSTERKQTKREIAAAACQDMRELHDAELNSVSGGFIIDGGRQGLGGPDTRIWAGVDLLRSKSLDRN